VLAGHTLVVDALPLAEARARLLVHDAARRSSVPVICAVDMHGSGASVCAFLPGNPSFSELSGIEDGATVDEDEALARSVTILMPGVDLDLVLTHARALGWLAGEVVRVARLINEGAADQVSLAPSVLVYSPTSGTASVRDGHTSYVTSRSMRLRRLRATLRERMPLLREAAASRTADHVEFVLDAARWAPSTDNRQAARVSMSVPSSSSLHPRVPSRLPRSATLLFLTIGGSSVGAIQERQQAFVHIELGAFLENARLAAAQRNLSLSYLLAGDEVEGKSGVEALLLLAPQGSKQPRGFLTLPSEQDDSVLYNEVRCRHTDRRSFHMTPIPTAVTERLSSLAAALGVSIVVHSSAGERWDVARLSHRGYQIRGMQDHGALDIAQSTEWTRYTTARMPGHAMGISRSQLPAVRFLCRHPAFWRGCSRRVPGANFFGNMDSGLVPSIRCGAHLTFSLGPDTPWTEDAVVRGAAAVQRCWLYLSSCGISAQPNMAPVAFSWAHSAQSPMALDRHVARSTVALATKAERAWAAKGTTSARVLVQLRVGFPTSPIRSRALRNPLSSMWTPSLDEVETA
jgi:hypothetical protein